MDWFLYDNGLRHEGVNTEWNAVKAPYTPIQDGRLQGCSQGRGEQKGPPSLESVAHISQWWNFAQLYLIWNKYIDHVTLLLSSADISNFPSGFSKFCYTGKLQIKNGFDTKSLILVLFLTLFHFIFFGVLQACFNTFHDCNFHDFSKYVYSRSSSNEVFWNKGYYIIIFVHDVTSKIFSHYSNFIVFRDI